ncbi:MAG TPA: dienelactone hydrolase family protein [Gemmatimonadota bacterium]|jgi:carboxymethylenebutenolidase
MTELDAWRRSLEKTLVTAALAGTVACGQPDRDNVPGAAAAEEPAAGGAPASTARATSESPRHGEYVMYATAGGDSVRAFVVYPERPDAAPGVIVIHEIFGLSDWIRSVADRYAAEGFIAIAPDLLWGKGPGGGGSDAYPSQDALIAAIRELTPVEVKERLDGAYNYLRSLPSASGRVGTVGFCWGGHQSFQYAADQPGLGAAVVFYGSAPEPLDRVGGIRAPVLGLYGGDDNRINAGIPAAESAMTAAGKRYQKEIYPGAGHGFLREAQAPGNVEAAAKAWPRSVEFLKAALGAKQG